jgi:hypothetical protein
MIRLYERHVVLGHAPSLVIEKDISIYRMWENIACTVAGCYI